MRTIAMLSDSQRAELFEATSYDMGLNAALVEKDFWVSYTLDVLFHKSPFREDMVFKGGTSLSKGFGLIQRFSEDIDLILDWRLLGYGLDEPWEERSNTKQEKFRHESIERTEAFLQNDFTPAIKKLVSDDLSIEADIHVGGEEETVVFSYPRLFSSSALLSDIKLEIGPMAAWSPSEVATIEPYVACVLPEGFGKLCTSVRTVKPERTFWEKAAILHQEASRPESKAMPRRYSRHYYDMYRLGHSFVLEKAIEDADLLAQVVRFKEKFYRTPWAKLADAKPGMLKLVPSAYRMQELADDYDSMQSMLFGDSPSFDEISAYMAELESIINKTASNK